MIQKLLANKLREYAPANAIEQGNALQELLQHFVLAALARSGFFSKAVFHGGTCLRMVNGLNRFSEDLDFLLKRPDPDFEWKKYLEAIQKDCRQDGMDFEIQDKPQATSAVKKAFLKNESLEKILAIDLPFARGASRKIRIKLEIDTNPPRGSDLATSYITFPTTVALTTQPLESSFALKLHALFCRPYVKGRDWFDFIWYTQRRTRPNLPLLQAALFQHGPWNGRKLKVTPKWLHDTLAKVIGEVDWKVAQQDVQRFLPQREQEGLKLWSEKFFRTFLAHQ